MTQQSRRRPTTAGAAPGGERSGTTPGAGSTAGARTSPAAQTEAVESASSGTMSSGALRGFSGSSGLSTCRVLSGLAAGLARLRAGLAGARRLWRDFTGESAYDRYVERHRREHPDHEPLSERQWWRARAEFDERNVSTGCC